MTQRSARCRVAAVLAVSVVVLGAGCRRERSFTITFKDAKGLRPGQFLSFKGLRAGEVTAVDLGPDQRIHVAARLYAEYRAEVSRNAVFRIENPRGLLDLSGERQITISQPDTPSEPIRDGDVLRGSEGRLDDLLGGVRQAADTVAALFKDLASSPEAQAVTRSMQDFANRGQRLAGEQYEAFKREQLPALRAEAERVRKQLEAAGQPDQARKFWDEFSAWVRGIEGATR